MLMTLAILRVTCTALSPAGRWSGRSPARAILIALLLAACLALDSQPADARWASTTPADSSSVEPLILETPVNGQALLLSAQDHDAELMPVQMTTGPASSGSDPSDDEIAAPANDDLPNLASPAAAHMRPMLLPIHGPSSIEMEVTAYCACKKCCGPKARGVTASGRPVSHNRGRFVAADTRLLPFGTKLVIPGYAGGRAVEVIDRGGAIKGYKLDVYFPSHQQAKAWGRRKIMVKVVG
jgi:3D (Asp-Asp-Asp) domain-containing protein